VNDGPVGLADPPPRRVGRYEIIRELGRGGMARVHLARQVNLNREVALKELSGLHVGSPELASRFLRESQLAGSLNHPNVVTVLEYLEIESTPYIAMEYVARGSLRPYLRHFDLAAFAGVMEGVLAGLAHAASRSIVHRDLKPENILVTGEGRIKIADFGIAKATEVAVATTQAFATTTGTIIGTPQYMSPEQILGKDVSTATDLYSLGVIAYEYVVGRAPFDDTSVPTAILMRHVNETIPAPRDVNATIDRELSAWIAQLLVKDPSGRPQDPLEAWEQLEEIVLRLLGPRWRRSARLTDSAPASDAPQPLTPAEFAAPPSAVNSIQTILTGEVPAVQPIAPEPAPASSSGRATPNAMAAPRRGARRRRAAVLLAGLVLIAAAAGFLIGHHSPGNSAQAATVTAHGDHLNLSIPTAWRTLRHAPMDTHVPLTGPVLRRDPRSGGELLAGVDPQAQGKLLLPPGFVDQLVKRPTSGDPVMLGAGAAYRYQNLRLKGEPDPMTVFAVPTTAGVIAVVCRYPSTSAAQFAAACVRSASTLRVTGTRRLGLGPQPAYARTLTHVVTALTAAAGTVRQLDRAASPKAQARFCRELSRQVRSTASLLAGARPGPDAAALNTELIRQLRAAADGYATMSAAAQENHSKRYNVARVRTERALRGYTDAIGSLRSIGYGMPNR